MAEPTEENKTKDQSLTPDAEGSGELSLDQLDGMILSEDPEFAKDLANVKALTPDGSIDLDVVDLGESFQEKENPWRDVTGFRKFLTLIFPFLPRAWDFQYRLFSRVHLSRARFRNLLREAGPQTLAGLKAAASSTSEFAKNSIAVFKSLTWRLKIVAVMLILTALSTVGFIYLSFTHGVLPAEKELLMASLEEWGEHTYSYDPDTEMDSFYDSPRSIQNIMALPKMVVNIQASPSSGPNPMAALEFFLEGLSPEAIIEVKDRETEVRDLFQRTLEEMSYGELSTSEGKQQLTERLRVVLNQNLTKGKIRRIFIKEIVLKP